MKPRRSSVRCGTLLVTLALILGFVAAGCEDLGGTDEGTAAIPTSSAGTGVEGDNTTSSEGSISSTETLGSTTTGSPVTTPSAAALSSAETLLPNGHIKAAGIIDDAWQDSSGRHLRIDYVDVLTWDQAVAAGMEDPADPHDGFWYSNVNPMLRTFAVSDSAAIFTSYRGYHVDFDTPCTWEDFMSFWAPAPPPGDDYMHEQLWWIERDGDTIVWISQQFIP